jgi:hypothetical protein
VAWPTPKYSRSQVNKAGKIITTFDSPKRRFDVDDFIWAFEVVDNWRSCHGYPINTFQATLRQKLKSIDKKGLVAQRLKRMPSIISKLKRFKSMQLSRMQDLGGIRAVVSSLRMVQELESNYENSNFAHELISKRDYIDNPKKSGYRSVHLVYRYMNRRATDYDGLYVELQIRTRLQHAWATAVETMGTFLNHALKASEGPSTWLEFFSLAGSAFAYLEKTKPVPGYENFNKEFTFQKTINEANKLRVRDRLQAFSIAAERIHLDRKPGSYHLIVLNLEERKVSIHTYGQAALNEASNEYAKVEKEISKGKQMQAVLVSAGPIENLRKAYPSYFLDTRAFISSLNRIEKMFLEMPSNKN